MNALETKTLEKIPSKIETNKVLPLIQGSYQSNMRSNIYFRLLKHLTASDDKEISHWLSLSEKTYRTHKDTENKTVKLSLIEHAIMIIALFKHGNDIFGDSERFKQWLNEKNYHFNKQAPIDFIDTISGIKFIDDRLTGLEYGDNA